MNEIEMAMRAMTGKQARRFAMHMNGEKGIDIARKEGVSPATISICLKNAEKRARKRLSILIKH